MKHWKTLYKYKVVCRYNRDAKRDQDKSSWPAERCRKSLKRVKLSNSGDPLKLLVPSYSLKAICGWTNYSCMVISQKIYENIMGYRGSKSVANLTTVKEQRVDGSWCNNLLLRLRYTLVGFERSYPIKILSKQINKAKYSTLALAPNLNPSQGVFNRVCGCLNK